MLMRNFGLTHALVAILVASWILAGVRWRLRINVERERVSLARKQVNELQGLVGRYTRETGRVPGSLEEVVNAFDPPVTIKDPWGAHQYRILLHLDGTDSPVIINMGADRMPGGDGFGKDIIADPQ